MARNITLLIVGLLITAGCQSGTGLVDHLPGPNFNAPVVTAQRVAVAPRSVAARPPAPVARAGPVGADRSWIPAVPPRQWKWIVVHHSATASGSATTFDAMHRAKGWDELGYDFVIGNGTQSRDGQIEVGPRWTKQKWGAHAKTADNRYNEYGVGICLVGNFDIERPTAKQMQSLARLTAYLMRTYRISASDVIGHRDTKATDCPGKNLNVATIRGMAQRMLADAGAPEESAQTAGSVQMLHSTSSDGR